MSTRESALAAHHRALGSNLEDWNGMGAPWTYHSDPCDEHDAVRERAGLFDVSGLKKVRVRGRDAAAVCDHVITRDMTKIPIGRSAYGPVLQDDGGICDDAIIFNVAEDDYLFVHGAGAGLERLHESAEGKQVSIAFDDDLHDISLQGPAAVGFLDQHTPIDLPALGYFHQAETTLFGRPVLISRTGYSGERGYEIFATAEHVVPLWEEILGSGGSAGIVPCSFTCLDKIRIEAALLFYPYDMTEVNTPWEVTMGWSVSRKKGDFPRQGRRVRPRGAGQDPHGRHRGRSRRRRRRRRRAHPRRREGRCRQQPGLVAPHAEIPRALPRGTPRGGRGH